MAPIRFAALGRIGLKNTRLQQLLTDMLKIDFHTHTADDPHDLIPHSAFQLIDRAATLGYHALAITLHDRQLDVRPFAPYAQERGVALIPGVERTIRGKHVLLINFSAPVDQITSFDELESVKKRSDGLVVAPHAFYPGSNCLQGVMDEYPALFDAVEVNAFYTARINFNRSAIRWAAKAGKPLVGNGDVHRLRQLGSTYSLVEAEPDADAICGAVKKGNVAVQTRALSPMECARILGPMLYSDFRCVLRGRDLERRTRPQPAPRNSPF